MPKKNEVMVRDKLPLKFFTQPDLTSCSITCLAYAFGLYYYNDYDNSSVIREYCRLDLAFFDYFGYDINGLGQYEEKVTKGGCYINEFSGFMKSEGIIHERIDPNDVHNAIDEHFPVLGGLKSYMGVEKAGHEVLIVGYDSNDNNSFCCMDPYTGSYETHSANEFHDLYMYKYEGYLTPLDKK